MTNPRRWLSLGARVEGRPLMNPKGAGPPPWPWLAALNLSAESSKELRLGGGLDANDTRQCRCEGDHDRATRPRAVAPEMARGVDALVADARVTRWIGGGEPWERGRSEQRFDWMLDHWRRHGFGWRATLDRESCAWVGFVELNYVTPDAVELDEGEVETGCWLQPEVWGQGVAHRGGARDAGRSVPAVDLSEASFDTMLATPPRDGSCRRSA